MRAVKLDKHTGFADENDMYSYFVSAKSGDNVASAFHRIAADWAGVVLTKPEMEIAAVRSPLPSPQQRWLELSTFLVRGAQKPVVASIVNHARDAELPEGDRTDTGEGGCTVQ